MLPTELVVGPLAHASITLCAVLALLRLAAEYQKRRSRPNETVSPGATFSHREKARLLSTLQVFCFGMACALTGAVFFVLHEASTHRNAALSHSAHTSVAITSALAQSSQKVR